MGGSTPAPPQLLPSNRELMEQIRRLTEAAASLFSFFLLSFKGNLTHSSRFISDISYMSPLLFSARILVNQSFPCVTACCGPSTGRLIKLNEQHVGSRPPAERTIRTAIPDTEGLQSVASPEGPQTQQANQS